MTERQQLCGSQIAFETACKFGGKADLSDPLAPMLRCGAPRAMFANCPYADAIGLHHKKWARAAAMAAGQKVWDAQVDRHTDTNGFVDIDAFNAESKVNFEKRKARETS